MKTTITLLFLFAITMATSFGQQKFSANEIKEDFKYLYETLESSSYDLFIYTPKSVFDKEYEAINNSITDSLSLFEISRLFQAFVALADIQHCSIDFPLSDYQYFYQNGGRFFPFEVAFIDDKPTVALDYTENPKITVGDQLISVGEVPIHIILDKMYTYMSGENDYVRKGMIESGSFWDKYWFAYGDFSDTIVRVKKRNGDINTVKVTGVLLSDYIEYIDNHPDPHAVTNPIREIKFIKKVAYLQPGPFFNTNSETDSVSEYAIHKRDEFNAFIDSAFLEISKRNTRGLIIDIRGNPGGSDNFSNYMMAYFADRPFSIASKISMRTSQVTKDYWKDLDIPEAADMKKQIMALENGTRFTPDLDETKPRKDTLHYNGNVYLLIDRFTYSMAMAVASIVQDYSFGVLIGEETSAVPSSCASMHDFLLPNTKIKTYYPKAFGIRPNGDASSHGVVPDFYVEQDIFTVTDEVLDYTLNMINSN